MTDAQHAPLLFFWCSVAIALFSAVALLVGKRIPRALPFFLGVSALGLSGIAIWAWLLTSQEGAVTRTVGWIWPRTDLFSIVLGMRVSPLLALICFAVSLVFLVLAIGGRILEEEPRQQRLFGAAGLALAACVISICAQGMWFGLVGYVLAVGAAVLSCSTGWDSASDAVQAARVARDGLWAALLGVLGGGVLLVSVGPESASSLLLGVLLFFGAIFFAIRPGFLSGWIRGFLPSVGAWGWRLILIAVVPSFCALLQLSHLVSSLRSTGIFLPLSLLASLATLGFALSAFFAATHGQSVAAHVGALASWAIVLCSQSAPGTEPWVFVAFFLGASALVTAHASFEFKTQSQSESALKKAKWGRFSVLCAFLAAHGAPGFLTARLSFRFFATLLDTPLEGTIAAVAWVFVLFSGLRLLRNYWSQVSALTVPWPWVTVSGLLGLALLALPVDGSLSGGLLAAAGGEWDLLTVASQGPSLLGLLAPLSEDALLYARSFYLAAWVVALILLWISVRVGMDRWKTDFPRWTAFVSEGFGMDRVAVAIVGVVAKASAWIVRIWDERWWADVFPRGLRAMIEIPARRLSAWDQALREFLEGGLRRGVEIPSRALQLTQSGDLRWYIFWAVMGVVLLLLNTTLELLGKK